MITMLEHFTPEVHEALASSGDWATWLAHDEVRPAHLVLALAADWASPFPALVTAVRQAYPQLTPPGDRPLTFSRELRAAMAELAGFHAGATVQATQLLDRLRDDPVTAAALTRAGMVLPEPAPAPTPRPATHISPRRRWQ
ncbi:hypothetical protein [Actinoplanes sp. NBRC 103695]|uniref:hypothetical protein n=1 Tax=Actinoplanes sp. NBRC 103695 TaxID=3032202 RepID=UPI0024A2D4F7|nr:hypothetical protein [Actinoplanes sp. NBRC 103695]GLY96615.1 hypothetical protein Acsp02_38700 [Actinoplanes sp. NBRC 103695]